MATDRWLLRVIDASLKHRWSVLAVTAALAVLAGLAAWQLKLDALPDLSPTQVIVKAEYPGQPPRLVEDQLTYPLATALLGVPGASTVRAYSMFGEAFVYVVFADGTEPERARARVLERTTQLQPRLPAGASLALGPDASGTGWVYQYALVSAGDVPLDRLRAIQDVQLRPALQGVPGVAEVASFGGAVRQLQVEVDPERMRALGIGPDALAGALRDANQARGGGAVEMGRQRLFISADARLRGPQDLPGLPVGTDASGNPVRLHQLARVGYGPAPREGVADLDGRGDVAGGIVVMRQGENAAQVVEAVKRRLALLQPSLPAGVSVLTTYDRSTLIHAAVRSLGWRLAEEGAVVAGVCLLFLWRLRSAWVAIATLPLGLLAALALLQRQGVTANIMSLGGLAIAIGAMVDAAVVMVETLHRKLERRPAGGEVSHRGLVRESAREVGPALFFSLLVITVSFLPVFSLQGAEGRLFAPLALTKTWAMAAAAAMAVTVVPVLMGLLIRGPVQREHRNPLNRALKRLYRPALKAVLARPAWAMAGACAVAASAAWPLCRLGSEFMPPLDEGDLLYMPTTLPSVSVDEAADILSRSNALILAQPEVAHVHGKAGRSDSATDPAPLSMIETTVMLKPRAQWPDPGLGTQALMARLDEQVRLAGLGSAWGHPIRTRIEMLSTGVKTPLALRIVGPDAAQVQALAEQAEGVLRGVPGVRAAFAERVGSGRFIAVELDRAKASLYGVRAADLAQALDGPVGGTAVDVMATGRERTPIVLRYPRDERSSLAALGRVKLGGVSLDQVATLRIQDGPSEIRSEDAQPVGHVLLDLADDDVGGVLSRAEAALARAGAAGTGYTREFVGQYLRLQQATLRLWAISLGTLAAVLAILYWHLRSGWRVATVLAGLPVALAGALWFCLALGLQWSFATAVGCLALAGVAAEFCVVMLLYLDQELARGDPARVPQSILRGALLRLRPKAMTVSVILGGLLPLLWSDGGGVDVMRRIAAPLVGGMLTAPLYSLLVVPAVYRAYLARRPAGRGL